MRHALPVIALLACGCISAEVAPGTLLREEELTDRLGLGRTPIREAIQRLRREGYVTILPRRGTLVSEISITDLKPATTALTLRVDH